MSNDKSESTGVDGSRHMPPLAEPIAFSLVVYERKCLDIPVNGIIGVEAHATQSFFIEEQGPVTFDMPHVAVWLAPKFQQRLRDFTRGIVGDVMELFVDGKCISRPVVREPLGNESSFLLSADDLAEAQRLAEQLRRGWRRLKAVE
jgi:preprotein translocase subunit SecD